MRELNLHKARRILGDSVDLSLHEISWEAPVELYNKINRDNHFETFVSLGEWINTNQKFILVSKEGTLIYLEKEIVEAMWKALK